MHIPYRDFIEGPRVRQTRRTAISLFSGGGLGDYGLMMSGFHTLAAVEIDASRAAVLRANVHPSYLYGDISRDKGALVTVAGDSDVDLVVATPPCQSFSTANPRRGLLSEVDHAARDSRNALFFHALDVIQAVSPKVVFFENVPNFLNRAVMSPDGTVRASVGEFLQSALSEYHCVSAVVCMSKFGVPQRRKRAVAIFVRKDVAGSGCGWSAEKVSLESWLEKGSSDASAIASMAVGSVLADFPPLDAASSDLARDPADPMHSVPVWAPERYRWVAAIPPGSGRSALDNDRCDACGFVGVPPKQTNCCACGSYMLNRPHVRQNGRIRLIKGFKTSYRRMHPAMLASTVTTTSYKFSSDLKIHPYQNRVLSARECAHLQTIPNSFDWSPVVAVPRRKNLAREVIGEAVPPWFAYQLGLKIEDMLA